MSRGLINLLGISGALVVLGQVPDAQAKTRQVNCSSSQATQAAKYLFEQRTPTILPGAKGRKDSLRLLNPWRLKDIRHKRLDRVSVPLHGIKSKIKALGPVRLGYQESAGVRQGLIAVDIDTRKMIETLYGSLVFRSSGLLRSRVPWLRGIWDHAYSFPAKGDWSPNKAETITENRKIIERNVGKQPAKNSRAWELLKGFYDENANSPAIDNSFRRISHDSSFTIPSRAWQGSKVLLLPFDHVNAPQRLNTTRTVEFSWSKSGWADVTASVCLYAIKTTQSHGEWVQYGRKVKSIKPVKIRSGYKSTGYLNWSGKSGLQTIFDVYGLADQGFRFNNIYYEGRTHHLFGVVSLQSYSNMPVSTTLNFYVK